jgi:hypothetical protein
MRPRHAVLLTPSDHYSCARILREDLCTFVRRLHEESSHPIQSLFRQHVVRVSPLAATLMAFPASVANKRLTVTLSPLAATLTKNRGEGVLLLLTRGVNQKPNKGYLSPATIGSRPTCPDLVGGKSHQSQVTSHLPRIASPPVPNRTDDYTLPQVYSHHAILPSLHSADRPFLPRWRSS